MVIRDNYSLTLTYTSYDFLKSFLPNVCQKGLSHLPRYTILIYILTLSNIKSIIPTKVCSNYLYPTVKNFSSWFELHGLPVPCYKLVMCFSASSAPHLFFRCRQLQNVSKLLLNLPST